MAKIYAGQIVEMSEPRVFGDNNESVINVIVGFSKKLFGDITVQVKQTVVLFKKHAEKAQTDLKEGDFALFHEVTRSPRVWERNGKTFEVVDLTLDRIGSFQKMTKKSYEDNLDAITDNMVSEDELQFTDADRVALASIAEGEGVEDTDVDTLLA